MQVFFAYTKDGQQFDGIEASCEWDAREDICRMYAGDDSVLLSDGTAASLTGFKVRAVPVSLADFRTVTHLSRRLALCADPMGLNAGRIGKEFSAAHDRMMRALAETA